MNQQRTNQATDPITLEKIKEEYIYGTVTEDGPIIFQSYAKLAEQHQTSESAIKRAGRDGKWKKLRDEHRAKTKLKVNEKKSEFAAAKSVQSDDKFENTFELGRIIGKMQLERYKAHLEKDEENFISGYHFKCIIDGIKAAQEGIKTALGEPSDYSHVQGEVKGRYEVTKSLICSDEHIMNELRLLNAAGRAQRTTD
jgi:hypothetical protein